MYVRRYPNLWQNCVFAACPSHDNSRSTRVTDFSGYGNHGTLTNMDPGTDWVASGNGVALDFDGSNDYVDIGSNAILKPTTVVSVSGWCRVNTAMGFGRLVTSRTSATTDGYILSFDTTGLAPRFGIGNGTLTTATSSSSVVAGIWNHLCGTWDGATVRVYLNGAETGSGSKSAISYTAGSVTLGSEFNPAFNSPVIGQLDDIRIYQSVLVPSDIRTLALRRGIAYETKRNRVCKIATAAASRRRNIVWSGF